MLAGGLKWLMLTFRQVRLFFSLRQNGKQKPLKNQICHLNTNFLIQASKILENKAFKMYMFEVYYFSFSKYFVLATIEIIYSFVFFFSELLRSPPPPPFSRTYLSAVKKLWQIIITFVYFPCYNFKQQGAQSHSVRLFKAGWGWNVCGFCLKRAATICAVPHLCWSVNLLPSRMPLVILLCVQKQKSIVQHLESHSDAGKEYNSLSKC